MFGIKLFTDEVTEGQLREALTQELTEAGEASVEERVNALFKENTMDELQSILKKLRKAVLQKHAPPPQFSEGEWIVFSDEERKAVQALIKALKEDGEPDAEKRVKALLTKGGVAAIKQMLGKIRKPQVAPQAPKKKSEGSEDSVHLSDMETVDLRDVPIFQVGEHKGRLWSDDVVDGIVRSTNRVIDRMKPYVKLGHNPEQKLADGYPSLGWLYNLRKVGDTVFTDIRDVPKKLAGIVKAKGYRRVSVELTPNREIDGRKEPWLLKALAFLGADTPVIKTLDDIPELYYSDDDYEGETVELVFAISEEENQVTPEEAKKLQEENEALKKANEENEKALAEAKRAPVLSESKAFSDVLLSESKIRKDEQDSWVRVLSAVEEFSETVTFSDDEKSFAEELKSLLSNLPQMAENEEMAEEEDTDQKDKDKALADEMFEKHEESHGRKKKE